MSKFSIRQIIDLSLSQRNGGIDFVTFIHKNQNYKKNNINQLMNNVKYYVKNLHGYRDLFIHDNNIINITETNCKLDKYLHQLSTSRREHEEDGGGTIEVLVLEATSTGGGDYDDFDDDIGSTAIIRVLPVVALNSDSEQNNNIGVINISRSRNSTTIEATILNDSK